MGRIGVWALRLSETRGSRIVACSWSLHPGKSKEKVQKKKLFPAQLCSGCAHVCVILLLGAWVQIQMGQDQDHIGESVLE